MDCGRAKILTVSLTGLVGAVGLVGSVGSAEAVVVVADELVPGVVAVRACVVREPAVVVAAAVLVPICGAASDPVVVALFVPPAFLTAAS